MVRKVKPKSSLGLINELKQNLEINKDLIDDELAIVAQTFYEICDKLAEVQEVVIGLEADRKVVEADLDERVRDKLINREGKATEAMVKRALELEPGLLSIKEKIREASSLTKNWSNLREAYSMKFGAMKRIAELQISKYYLPDAHVSTETVRRKVTRRAKAK